MAQKSGICNTDAVAVTTVKRGSGGMTREKNKTTLKNK
jgi:hypothetical protein